MGKIEEEVNRKINNLNVQRKDLNKITNTLIKESQKIRTEIGVVRARKQEPEIIHKVKERDNDSPRYLLVIPLLLCLVAILTVLLIVALSNVNKQEISYNNIYYQNITNTTNVVTPEIKVPVFTPEKKCTKLVYQDGSENYYCEGKE